jgi:mycofactocin precursor
MVDDNSAAQTADAEAAPPSAPAPPVTVEEDLLVEEVSIDGMCGVY